MSSDRPIFEELEALIIGSAKAAKTLSPAEILAQTGAPSTSIAILQDGEITPHCLSTTGADTSTLFQACSLSKPTTAMALFKMLEQGLLSLSTPITTVLPSQIAEHLTKDPRTAPTMRSVTIRQLLSHTGGISVHGFPGYSDHAAVPSLTDVVLGKGNTATVELITLPGLEVMYSGGGVELLQLAMEHVLQKPFPEIMREYVFEPLGMNRSCYILPEGEKNVERCYLTGTWPTDSPWHVLPEQAAGGLWTTPTDLLKLIRAMQDSLNGKANSFMSQGVANEMVTAVKDAAALGWFVTDTKFAHSGGNWPGWTCYVFGYAALDQNINASSKRRLSRQVPNDCGIAVMTNSNMGIPAIDKILNGIAYLKDWPDFNIPASGVGNNTPLTVHDNARIPSVWKDWLGQKWAEEWDLVKTSEGLPAIKPRDIETSIALKPAATHATVFEDGRTSIDLVFDGFQLMIKLTWDEDERVVELWNGGTSEHKTLKASS